MKWAFVCCAHKRAASPPMRCAKRKRKPKTCGFAAGLPPTNLPLQKGELPRRKRRRSSKHPSSFFLQLFYYHQLPKLGVLLYGFPQFRQKLQLRENTHPSSKKSLCSGTPALLRGGSFFALWECGFFPFAAGICERSERVECAERTTRTLLKKRKCGRGNTYNNYYWVSFLPTHRKWWSRLPSSQHFPL